MRRASAQVAVERGLDLRLGRMRVLVEQRGGAHDHPVRAVSALRRLFFDECGLQGMRRMLVPQSLDGRDPRPLDRCDRILTRPDRRLVEKDRTRTALSKPTAELRSVQLEPVAQDVQQGFTRIVDRDGPLPTVQPESDVFRHAIVSQVATLPYALPAADFPCPAVAALPDADEPVPSDQG